MTNPSTFPLSGPVNLSVRLGHGSLVVHTRDDLTEASVSYRAVDPQGTPEVGVELVGRTLTVSTPRQGGLADFVPPWKPRTRDAVDVEVVVPSGTAMKLRSFTASITVDGRSGGADVATAAGTITFDEVDGDLSLRYGDTCCSVGRVSGSVNVRSGAGSARFGEIAGDLNAGCGRGQLVVGTARGTVRARSGAGEAELGAVYGDVDLASGAGDLVIGLPAGTTARLDLVTGSGQVDTELPVVRQPADASRAITVRARTGSGDVRLVRPA